MLTVSYLKYKIFKDFSQPAVACNQRAAVLAWVGSLDLGILPVMCVQMGWPQSSFSAVLGSTKSFSAALSCVSLRGGLGLSWSLIFAVSLGLRCSALAVSYWPSVLQLWLSAGLPGSLQKGGKALLAAGQRAAKAWSGAV